MAVILNASTSSGFVQSADTSGVITLQNNGTSALSVDSGNLQFNSGYGSVATAYGCRAWVNFNGTGTVAIRASGNVSSITDNGTGLYTVNFTTAMPDANYSSVLGCNRDGGVVTVSGNLLTVSTSSLQFEQFTTGGSQVDRTIITVAIFR